MKKEKKADRKPALKKYQPLVNITFATGAVTVMTGGVTITGGSPASGAATPT